MNKQNKAVLISKFNDIIQPKDYKIIPLTKGKFCKVDNEDFEKFKHINWNCSFYGYAKNSKYGYLHRLILNCNEDELIDHINNDKLDNRKSNLRICNRHQNNLNKKYSIGKSKYKGVSWSKTANKWRCTISYNKKQIHLGYFDDEVLAGKTYDSKAKELFKEFAYLNFDN